MSHPSPSPTAVATGPLSGTIVVEAASFVSGPFATMMLAQLGASVIKVEPPAGDPFRRFARPATTMSPLFANSNRGKRSVVIDLKTADGRDDLLALVARADVFLSNWRPEVAEKLSVSDDILATTNSRLIRAYVSGFGPSGPLADQPVFDSVIQARSGMTDSQRVGPTPAVATTYIADKIAATMAAQAVLAALLQRERTGLGERVDVAMLDTAAYMNFPDGMANRTFIEHQPEDARNEFSASVRPIRAADGWLMVAPVSGRQMQAACAAVGHHEWANELRAHHDIAAMSEELFSRLESVTITADRGHWLRIFHAHDVPAAPCHTLDEHLADEQVRHNAIYSIADTTGVGPTRFVRYPARFASHAPLGDERGAPALGEHTRGVLTTVRSSVADR